MDFELSENQAVINDAVLGIFEPFRTLAVGAVGYFEPAPALEQQLTESGFFDFELGEDFTALDAALIVYEGARLPVFVELGASLLVAPQMGLGTLPRPVALADSLTGAIRNLPGAKTLLLLDGDEAKVASLEGVDIETLSGVLAYPFGRLRDPSQLSLRSLGAGSGAKLATWWRVALAVEGAGQLKAAMDTTIEYVGQRQQFGRAIGSFQAVQHRLAASTQVTEGARWLAFRAAESGDAGEAAIAAIYIQDQMRGVINDVHQFSGAIGLTLEYPLHLWTYRLKALQGELGGVLVQGEAAASAIFEGGK